MLTIDFETEGIVGNPIANPPKPVGVAIRTPDGVNKYHAWGHPTGNNCTLEQGRKALLTALKAARKGGGWLAHNAAFESAVLREHFGYVEEDPLLVNDTQYLLFLTDPYAYSLSLKPSAERVLGMAPEEQADLREWILANVREAKLSDWGAYISKAPASIVGPYALGDTDRTWKLYEALMPRVLKDGMLGAYRREQKLMPIMSEASKRGVNIDRNRLGKDIAAYTRAKKYAEAYVFSRLGEFNIDSDAELAAALERADMVSNWVMTPTGRRSTARKNLVGNLKDPELLDYLSYRGVLATCLGTFANPWMEMSSSDGRVHPQWNQVRSDKGANGDMSGARTGRMSCNNPNLQNPPNDFENLTVPVVIASMLAEVDLPPVMLLRSYLMPEEGHVWVKRDFSAQEMRWLAYFTEGRLWQAFQADPLTDPHDAVRKLIHELMSIDMPRKYVKITGFGIMYGRGIPNLAAALGVNEDKGKEVRDTYFAALPEIRGLSDEIRWRGRRNEPITTWGGRKYYKEPHPTRDMSYKLLNYLIQGSGADQTKQSIIDWHEDSYADHHLLAPVHDEINLSVPAEEVKLGMQALQEAMDKERCDVPFRSEGYTGPNWAALEKMK
jgi:DNA polymerase I-like protein with 3'-5' exonuclease and polymerase domains